MGETVNTRIMKSTRAGALAVAAAILLAACGGGSSSSSAGSGSGSGGGIATVDLVSSPGTLDPGLAYTAQSQDADWLVYTGLLTYAHANGTAGSQVIPGLATGMPVITNGGKTYTLTLRSGLKYSNGKPVQVGDFAYAIERDIKLNWGGVSFLTTTIAGAADYQSGKASSISGIVSDPSTNQITINLISDYGPFDNVLAFTAAGLVPTGTPMTDQISNPPVGVGPYMFENVVSNSSFELVRTPGFASFHLPGVPLGHVDVSVSTESNPLIAAENVLQNKVDAFDPSSPIPATLLSSIKSTASSRFETIPTPWTFYFWMNTTIAPFDNKNARIAVSEAVDRTALERLSSGFLSPGCNFIPPGVVGHQDGNCVNQTNGPDVAKAKALVASSGLTGAPVTVWGFNTSPRSAYVQYYASVLNSIGFNASVKLTAPAIYGSTIGDAATKAQTGDGDWLQDFPNPVDFYIPLSAASINPTHNINYSYVDDPVIEKATAVLDQVPTSQLTTVAQQWASLDTYVNTQAYEFVYGYAQLSKFLSNRIDFATAIFSPIYLNDYSSWQLTS